MIAFIQELAGKIINQTPIKLWVGCFCVGMIAEWISERAQPDAKYLLNLRYSLIYLLAIFFLAPSVTMLGVMALDAVGRAHLANLNVLSDESILQQIASWMLYLLLLDFFYYWFHRAQHSIGLLWDQHEVHHSDTTLNVSTGARHHWSEFILQQLFVIVPLSVLFELTPQRTGVVAAVFGSWAFFNHLNIKLPLGRYSWLVVAPQLHWIHHSRLPQHLNRNFAGYFPVWDVLFGTYCAPERDEYPPVGLVSGHRIETAWSATVWPFTRWLGRLRSRLRAT